MNDNNSSDPLDKANIIPFRIKEKTPELKLIPLQEALDIMNNNIRDIELLMVTDAELNQKYRFRFQLIWYFNSMLFGTIIGYLLRKLF